MNLIPAPQYIDLQDSKHFHVLSKLTVSCHTRDVPLFDLLQSRLQNHCGVEVSFRFADRDADLLVTYAPNDQPGWHRIQIEPDKIHIFSADSEGLQYALVTLFHLIRVGNIPCGIIEDWPKYEHRGQLLDTTRHFFPIDEIKRIVEQISLLKFNRLHWVFANDQAWRMHR